MEGLGVGMTLGPRIASSSLSACWGRACKQTLCPSRPARLRFPPALQGPAPLPGSLQQEPAGTGEELGLFWPPVEAFGESGCFLEPCESMRC